MTGFVVGFEGGFESGMVSSATSQRVFDMGASIFPDQRYASQDMGKHVANLAAQSTAATPRGPGGGFHK